MIGTRLYGTAKPSPAPPLRQTTRLPHLCLVRSAPLTVKLLQRPEAKANVKKIEVKTA